VSWRSATATRLCSRAVVSSRVTVAICSSCPSAMWRNEVDGDLAGPLMTTLARVSAAVKTVCSADGVSIRQNNGKHGGQDVFHVHFHVVPRFAGDGFIGLDRALGMVDVSMEERIEQARKLSDELRRLSST